MKLYLSFHFHQHGALNRKNLIKFSLPYFSKMYILGYLSMWMDSLKTFWYWTLPCRFWPPCILLCYKSPKFGNTIKNIYKCFWEPLCTIRLWYSAILNTLRAVIFRPLCLKLAHLKCHFFCVFYNLAHRDKKEKNALFCLKIKYTVMMTIVYTTYLHIQIFSWTANWNREHKKKTIFARS